MRAKLLITTLSFILSALAYAEVPNVAPALQAQEWNNNRPEQRQALDNFYRSLQQQQLHESLSQRQLRLEHLEQLRDMTPEQRQQRFLDFVQQRQQQQILLPNR